MMGFSISLPKICHCHILLTLRASHFPDIMHHCLVAKNANYEKSNHVQETEKKASVIPEPLRAHVAGCRAGLSQLSTTIAHSKPVGQQHPSPEHTFPALHKSHRFPKASLTWIRVIKHVNLSQGLRKIPS